MRCLRTASPAVVRLNAHCGPAASACGFIFLPDREGERPVRMTRDSYARQVWKAIQAIGEGENHIPCPHENCAEELRFFTASLRAGTAVVCPQHGVIFRE